MSRAAHKMNPTASKDERRMGLPHAIRDTLFGDMPLNAWPSGDEATDMPWLAFVEARQHLRSGRREQALACWWQVLQQPEVESRQQAQAWHFLRQHGEQPPADLAKTLLGVVLEVGMPQGLDLLAAYPDHTARYYNFSGAGVVWERPDESMDGWIDALLDAGRNVVARIGPWDQPRPQPPAGGQVRLNFLTPSGLHFGQGPMEVLAADPLGRPVIEHGTRLMQALIALPRGRGQGR
jgi:hypothetical protein